MLIKLNGYIYYLGCPVINKFRFIQKSKFSASDKIIMIFSQMKFYTMFSFVFPRLSLLSTIYFPARQQKRTLLHYLKGLEKRKKETNMFFIECAYGRHSSQKQALRGIWQAYKRAGQNLACKREALRGDKYGGFGMRRFYVPVTNEIFTVYCIIVLLAVIASY